MRLVFAGTPAVAVTSLRALLASRHTVAAVVTRPDAAVGRGRRMESSPVAALARSEGLEVLTPARPREPDFLQRLREIAPDCCPVTAYGALLPGAALDIPRFGWVNLHFSLLPAWRGAAPVQRALLHGDDITGATTFRLVAEMDAGPVYGVVTEPVRPADTSGYLLERLASAGSSLLVATLDGIEDGTLRAQPQPDEGVSFAPKLSAADARVDWKLPAHLIDRVIRACTPEPGAWTELDGARVKLWPVMLTAPAGTGSAPAGTGSASAGVGSAPAGVGSASAGTASALAGTSDALAGIGSAAGLPELVPGELHVTRSGVHVGTGSWPVRLGDVQPPGKRQMPAADWARGLRLGSGSGRPGFS